MEASDNFILATYIFGVLVGVLVTLIAASLLLLIDRARRNRAGPCLGNCKDQPCPADICGREGAYGSE